MSNSWLNIRIWRFHIQCRYGELRPRFSYNDYWAKWIIPKPFAEICHFEWRGWQ